MKSLIRTASPGDAAAVATRRLVGLVAEWPAGSALEITIAPARGRRRLHVQFRHHGAAHPGWRSDVRWALEGVATLRSGERPPEIDAGSVVELRPAVLGTQHVPAMSGTGADAWLASGAAPPAWPAPAPDRTAELLRVVAAGSVAYRVHLAPSSLLEESMVRDAVAATWNGDPEDLLAYLGRPVRVRAMLAGVGGDVPPLARMAARGLASHLDLVTTDGDAWRQSAAALAGHAVPVGLAHCLVRVPAAGCAPVPGLRTEPAPLQVVALDPVPPPPPSATAVRLGSAWTAAGRRTAVLMDVADLRHHLAVIGGPGTGRTTAIVALARELERAGVACVVLDPRGDAVAGLTVSRPDDPGRGFRVVRCGDGVNGEDAVGEIRPGAALAVDLGWSRLGSQVAAAHAAAWVRRVCAEAGTEAGIAGGTEGAGPTGTAPRIVLVDDAHLLPSDLLAPLLGGGRTEGLGVVIATADRGLDQCVVRTLRSHAASTVLLRSSADGGDPPFRLPLGWPAGDLSRLPKLHAVATISRGDVVAGPFTLLLDHWTRHARRSGPTPPSVTGAPGAPRALDATADSRPDGDLAEATR